MALLLARALCGSLFHQAPLLASLISLSDRSLMLMSALRRTPPTTTISPILHMMSWASMGRSFLPAACCSFWAVNSKRSTSALGPLLRPPNVLRRAPFGRSSVTSYVGSCPLQSSARYSLYAFAQPSLESVTLTMVFVLWKVSAISGSFWMCFCSMLNPTPVPCMRMSRVSSNALMLSTAMKEQLYPAMLFFSSAGPAVMRARIDGMTWWYVMAWVISFLSFLLILLPRCSCVFVMKLT